MNRLAAKNAQARSALRRLRIPCARSVELRFPFTFDRRVNPGITVAFPAEENAVAAGSGTVLAAQPVAPFWAFSPDSQHASKNSYQVVIDHGAGVRTVVHGLSSTPVRVGQHVSRGDTIGTPLTSEVFFAVLYLGAAVDPQTVNRHFDVQNGGVILGEGGRLRYAPDFTVRDLSDGVVAALINGIRYFVPSTCAVPEFLVNVDFNGNGSKEGPAATSLTNTDFWNVYTPVEFTEIITAYFGCSGSLFNVSPVFSLRNYDGVTSVARMERVSPMTTDGGSQVRFDPMLSTWIGASTPVENTIKLRGLPAGSYRAYLYTGEVGSVTDFYVTVNGGVPVTATATPTGINQFSAGNNYVTFDFVLSAYAVLTIKGVGSWSGMQIKRT